MFWQERDCWIAYDGKILKRFLWMDINESLWWRSVLRLPDPDARTQEKVLFPGVWQRKLNICQAVVFHFEGVPCHCVGYTRILAILGWQTVCSADGLLSPDYSRWCRIQKWPDYAMSIGSTGVWQCHKGHSWESQCIHWQTAYAALQLNWKSHIHFCVFCSIF